MICKDIAFSEPCLLVLVDADAGAVFVCRRLLCTVLLMRSSICNVASDSDASDSVCWSLALTSPEFMGIAWACMRIPMMMSSSKNIWPWLCLTMTWCSWADDRLVHMWTYTYIYCWSALDYIYLIGEHEDEWVIRRCKVIVDALTNILYAWEIALVEEYYTSPQVFLRFWIVYK